MTNIRNSIDSKNEPLILHTNYDCHRICENRHNSKFLQGICKTFCNIENESPLGSGRFKSPTLSEKLADTDLKHGFPPSFPPILEPFHSQKPTMVDEIHNQDFLYF